MYLACNYLKSLYINALPSGRHTYLAYSCWQNLYISSYQVSLGEIEKWDTTTDNQYQVWITVSI